MIEYDAGPIPVVPFYLSAECENCDEEIYYGPCATTLSHNGLMVISYDFAAPPGFDYSTLRHQVLHGRLRLVV
jgi:hypothetical protein